MRTYRVVYMAKDERYFEVFQCRADDSKHAEEQCLNAYPECYVLRVNERLGGNND